MLLNYYKRRKNKLLRKISKIDVFLNVIKDFKSQEISHFFIYSKFKRNLKPNLLHVPK